MTKTFSAFVAALAIFASLGAVTTPVSALEASSETRGIGSVSGGGGAGIVASDPISSGDQGSGRVADFAGQTTGSGR